jgi:hypothetical protein
MAKKEAWEGAGISIDWKNLKADDYARIVRHIEKMPEMQDRLDWLDRLITEIRFQLPEVEEPDPWLDRRPTLLSDCTETVGDLNRIRRGCSSPRL